MTPKNAKSVKKSTSRNRVAKKPPNNKQLVSQPVSHPLPFTAASTPGLEQAAIRDLFWENVVREMLMGLAALREKHPEVFDGRFAVLTKVGERIPIAQVTPMFAMSMPATQDKANSQAVQCTIFRIGTPDGEVYTLPLHEIRGMHAISPELIERLQAEGELSGPPEDDGHRTPFGLAAFTALPKPAALPLGPPPVDPME